MLCASCGAIQPPDPYAEFFRVFDLPRSFALDEADLERRYKDMTKVLHPDRFARSDPQARRASLERSVQLNEAYRVLKDPVRRAEYLLLLHGIDVGESAGGSRPGQLAEHATLPVPQILLMEVLELREALAEAHAAKDVHEAEALIGKVKSRLATVMEDVGKGFEVPAPDYPTIAARLVNVRYYRRFLDEARLIWEQDADVSEGGDDHAG